MGVRPTSHKAGTSTSPPMKTQRGHLPSTHHKVSYSPFRFFIPYLLFFVFVCFANTPHSCFRPLLYIRILHPSSSSRPPDLLRLHIDLTSLRWTLLSYTSISNPTLPLFSSFFDLFCSYRGAGSLRLPTPDSPGHHPFYSSNVVEW